MAAVMVKLVSFLMNMSKHGCLKGGLESDEHKEEKNSDNRTSHTKRNETGGGIWKCQYSHDPARTV